MNMKKREWHWYLVLILSCILVIVCFNGILFTEGFIEVVYLLLFLVNLNNLRIIK